MNTSEGRGSVLIVATDRDDRRVLFDALDSQEFDAIYTAQDIGSYKPSPRNFDYMLNRLKSDLGLGPSDVLHVAQSLFHDHAPAKEFGLASAWIDRRHAQDGWGATPPPPGSPRYDFRFESMAALADAHRKQLRAA